LINFAHGDVYMVGAFAGFYIALSFGLAGPSFLSLTLVLVGAMLIAAAVGMVIERFAYRPVRKYSRMTTLIMAIGVSLLIENLFVARIGAAPRAFPDFLGSQSQPPYHLFGNAAISKAQIVIFLLSIALMLLLQWIVFKTKVGIAMRAVSFNLNSAKLMGINTDAIISLTFAIGSSLAAAGGVLTAQYNPNIDPLMGILTGLKAFVAAVLGGLLIGIAETFVVGYGQHIGIASTYRDAVAFAILILVLLLRPSGLLGATVQEKV
jgi:branched-chain amino acid transport system permease protein